MRDECVISDQKTFVAILSKDALLMVAAHYAKKTYAGYVSYSSHAQTYTSWAAGPIMVMQKVMTRKFQV